MRFSNTLALIALMSVCVAQGGDRPFSLVANGGYEKGLSGWNTSSKTVSVVPSPAGGNCLEIKGPSGASQDVYVGPKPRTFTVAVDLKARDIAPEKASYAYVAVYQLNLQGEMVAFHDFIQLRKTADWNRYSYTFDLAPGAETVSLRAGIFNATGTAWFDNWTLVEGGRACRFDEVAEPQAHTRTEKGVVGIFKQDGFPAKGAPSSPDALAEMLKAGGVETKLPPGDQLIHESLSIRTHAPPARTAPRGF